MGRPRRLVARRPRLALPQRTYLLHAGPLARALELGRSPNLLWPADRSWFLASEIDFDSTLVGGSRDLAAAILGDPQIEAARVREDDSLRFDADAVNGGGATLAPLTELLAGSGFVAAEEEAGELIAAAAGNAETLDALVARRLTGEPLAWITGTVVFCDLEIRVASRGVRAALAERGARPPGRRAAAGERHRDRPVHRLRSDRADAAGAPSGSRVVATDLDERAVACARSNGVEAVVGDLFGALPDDLLGCVDVVVGVVPYVPTPELPLLQRDTFAFETTLSYDGGEDGLAILRRVIADARAYLRPGGALLLELGGEQGDALREELERLGYTGVEIMVDEDGDVRGVVATRR